MHDGEPEGFSPADGRRFLVEATRAALKGQPLSPPALSPDALGERIAAGEPAARRTGLVLVHASLLSERVAASVGAEQRPLALADGSALALIDAERTLAKKEARRVFDPLRALLDDKAREASPDALAERFVSDAGRLGIDASLHVDDCADAGLEPLTHDALVHRLEAFLSASDEGAHAARAVLAHVGGVPVERAAEIARALDLPEERGAFADAEARRRVKAAQSAWGHVATRPVARVRVPRALAGAVFDADGAGLLGIGVAPTVRFGRFFQGLEGLAGGLLRASGLTEPPWARALALGLLSAESSRQLALPKDLAQHIAQVAWACALLEARGQAAFARATLDAGGLSEEARREASARAFGDALPERARVGAALPWPVDGARSLLGAGLLQVVRACEGAAGARAFRDSLDADFALSPAFAERVEAHLALDAGDPGRRFLPAEARLDPSALVDGLLELL